MSKAIDKIKRRMAEEKWYGSAEHFRTEKSYKEHLEDVKAKLRKKKERIIGGVKTPSFQDLMKM